ncbi:MAG TPA: hypothetical protein VIY51_29090 [Xanthobacteraceae bacterium]
MTAHRNFLLLVTLAAAAVTPAVAQTTLPAVAAGSTATPGAAPIPDFSGIWAHLTWPDVEPPRSGPGPVRNLTLRNGAPDIYKLVGDYKNPILRPQAAAAVKRQGEIESSAGPAATPSNQCWPGGMPFVLSSNIGMQMLQRRDEITILYTNDHEVRRVRMNQPHPAQVTPSWYGDSVGHYEGDTLVIDTVGVKIGPFAMLDMYGTPHSPALHVVEHYRLLDYEAAKEAQERGQRELTRFGRDPGLVPNPNYKGKGLQLEFTVEDGGVFTVPWSAAVSYRRPTGDWPEVACAESADGYWPGRHVAAPTADKSDF